MYYVFNCDNEKNELFTRAELRSFVRKEGTVFGNFPQQKRVAKSKIIVYGFPLTINLGHRLIKYIVYDEFYNLVDYKVLEEWAYSSHYNKYRQFSWKKKKDYKFRNGPVPGVYKYKNTNYFRRPQTLNEMRANCDPEYKKYTRSGRHVPTSFDDISISSRNIKRSWKKNKKRKQWM